MNKQNQLTKISQVRRQATIAKGEFNTIGVIIDCTNIHRKDAKKDFCIKVKIIDASSPTEPLHAFLFSKHAPDFPQTIKFGDILLLNKYGFDIWNGALQAKKQFKVLGSDFRFFSGEPSLNSYSQIGEQSVLDDFDSSILNAIRDLRKFSSTYFKKNPVPLYVNNNKQSSDFDMIVRVNQSEKLNEGYKIHMANATNELEIHYNYDVAPGIYKLRSIANYTWNGKIFLLVGNDYTYFLQLSDWMRSYDSKEWEKLPVVKSHTENKVENDRLETKILNEKRGEKRKQVKLHDLITQDFHVDEVCVVVEFVQCFSTFKSALKKYDSVNHVEKSYESADGDYIYSIHYAVTDESMNGQIFNIYIYTYDMRGMQFLPGLESVRIFGKNILATQQTFEHINDRLLEETDLVKNPLRIILSPMSNGHQTIYRLVDTQLLM